jgi:hypothetical protein
MGIEFDAMKQVDIILLRSLHLSTLLLFSVFSSSLRDLRVLFGKKSPSWE